MHIVVITAQNSQENKKKEIGELNFGINNYYTLQQTNAMLKILNVVINVSLKHTQSTHLHYHEPNHFISPLKTSNEAVSLSTKTELNHWNSTVCERVIAELHARAKRARGRSPIAK